MVHVETITPDCSRSAFRFLEVLRGVFSSLHQPLKTSHRFPQHPGRFLTVPCLSAFLITLRSVETGILRSLDMALYPSEFLCLLITALLMFSDSSLVFTIVTKEQGISWGFLKHWRHHSLANSRHLSTDNLSKVILIPDLSQVTQNVFSLYWFKGCQHQCHSNLTVFLFFSSCCYLYSFIIYCSVSNMSCLYTEAVSLDSFFSGDILHYVCKFHGCQ